MKIQKLPYIIYRDYPDYGYLTDNRNYGYDTVCKSSRKVGELIISKVGSIFYSVLENCPQTLEEIVNISKMLKEISYIKTLKSFIPHCPIKGSLFVMRTITQ